ATSLNVAKHGHPGLGSGHAAEHLAKDMADAAVGGAAPPMVQFDVLAGIVAHALGDHDDGEVVGLLTQPNDMRGDSFEVIGDFGHQDYVRAAGDTRCQCNLAAVTPHHFEDHHAVVTCRGGLQPIDRL